MSAKSDSLSSFGMPEYMSSSSLEVLKNIGIGPSWFLIAFGFVLSDFALFGADSSNNNETFDSKPSSAYIYFRLYVRD